MEPDEAEGARESSREPKRANQSQEGPRGLVSQLEPVKAREPERARGSQRKPKGARESQKEPERASSLYNPSSAWRCSQCCCHTDTLYPGLDATDKGTASTTHYKQVNSKPRPKNSNLLPLSSCRQAVG